MTTDTKQPLSCAQADTLMLKHMEGMNTPEEAQLLLAHVEDCQNCREEYLAFDMAMEFAIATDHSQWEAAPANFTANVMAAVALEKKEMVEVKAPTVSTVRKHPYLKFDILCGISLIGLALALVIAYRPEQVANVAYMYPVVDVLLTGALHVWDFMGRVVQAIAYSTSTLSIESGISIAALAFVLVAGSLLVVLQSQDEQNMKKRA